MTSTLFHQHGQLLKVFKSKLTFIHLLYCNIFIYTFRDPRVQLEALPLWSIQIKQKKKTFYTKKENYIMSKNLKGNLRRVTENCHWQNRLNVFLCIYIYIYC